MYLDDIAKVNVVNQLGVEASAVDKALESSLAEVVRSQFLVDGASGNKGRAHTLDKNHVGSSVPANKRT